MHYLGRGCQTQVSAMTRGAKLRKPAAAVAERTAAQFKMLPHKPKQPEWMALLRMLDKTGASYEYVRHVPLSLDLIWVKNLIMPGE